MDIVDEANDRVERRIAEGIARAAVAPFPAGTAGECHYCGGEFSRLVNNACAKCRDERGLP